MLDALQAALDAIAADTTVRVVVIAGSGPRVLPAGHDLEGDARESATSRSSATCSTRCSRRDADHAALPQPVIARVHGIATAAGCQLVAACDLAVATDDARFATSGINFGLFCATPGVPVSRNVVAASARSRCCSPASSSTPRRRAPGASSTASCPPRSSTLRRSALDGDDHREAARRRCAPARRCFYEQIEAPLAAGVRAGQRRRSPATCWAEAAQEGVGAFVAKRPPRWND